MSSSPAFDPVALCVSLLGELKSGSVLADIATLSINIPSVIKYLQGFPALTLQEKEAFVTSAIAQVVDRSSLTAVDQATVMTIVTPLVTAFGSQWTTIEAEAEVVATSCWDWICCRRKSTPSTTAAATAKKTN